jgi:hypothetical protein
VQAIFYFNAAILLESGICINYQIQDLEFEIQVRGVQSDGRNTINVTSRKKYLLVH